VQGYLIMLALAKWTWHH